jgi:hypothetical protein
MQLAEYLSENSLSYAEFARRIGAKHRRTVERCAKRARTPSSRMMHAISKVTEGKVSANDFFADAAE